MPAKPSLQAQVQAYRFGLRRRDAALQSGDALASGDPNRPTRMALFVGAALVAVLVVVFVVWSFISPNKKIGDAKLVLDKGSGALYVVRDGRLYPTLNLASALLVVGSQQHGDQSGSSDRPKLTSVSSSQLRSMPRGPVVGIPGAPAFVPTKSQLVPARWTACDALPSNKQTAPSAITPTTSVLIGGVDPKRLPSTHALLVTNGGNDYLLFDGKRARLAGTENHLNEAVARTLHLDGVKARPTSTELLNAIPASADVIPPSIPGMGNAPSALIGDFKIGDVVQVRRAGTTDYYVVLPSGVQLISRVLADLIRFSTSHEGTIPTVAPATIAQAQRAKSADLIPDQFPKAIPAIDSTTADPVVCASWDGSKPLGQQWRLSDGTAVPMPASAKPVPITGTGLADAIYLPPGRAAVVGAVEGQQAATSAPLYLVTDEGVRYPIPSVAVLGMLGLDGTALPAPNGLLNLLPSGPVLDPAEATKTWAPAPSSSGSSSSQPGGK